MMNGNGYNFPPQLNFRTSLQFCSDEDEDIKTAMQKRRNLSKFFMIVFKILLQFDFAHYWKMI